MDRIEIAKDIYWVGAVDWDVRTFHGHTYTTNRGTTYNAYLILDDTITLVDTVYGPFSREMIQRIKSVVDPGKIGAIIVNHVETDHSGALAEILSYCPKAKVYGTAKCKEGLYRHYRLDLDFHIVKTGDTVSLGKRTIQFLEAPMIHWPDSMFSYIIQDQILLSNDAFGQHYATSKRFDDEVDQCQLWEEAAKYYANILIPLSPLIAKKIAEVQKANIPIRMIAPSHGILWRKDPARIIAAYASWANNTTTEKVVIIYETMWGSTQKMARKIAEGIGASGITVKLFDVALTDRTEIIKELLDARGLVVGSSTHDNGMLSVIAAFLHTVKGLRPKNRVGCAFGSYGWAGGAVKEAEGFLKEAGIEITQPGLALQYVPDEADLKQCYDFGVNFANKIHTR